jgi:hypothetical protein
MGFFTVIVIESKEPKVYRSTGGLWCTRCCDCGERIVVMLQPNEITLSILCKQCDV